MMPCAGPDQKVELGGYCPVALVRRGGLLVPASTELGFVEAEGRVFGCSSRAYLQVGTILDCFC